MEDIAADDDIDAIIVKITPETRNKEGEEMDAHALPPQLPQIAQLYRVVQKMSARLRELASVLGGVHTT